MTTGDAPHAAPGVPDAASLGQMTAEILRQTFPQWRVFEKDGTWWAARGGMQQWSGPRSLLQRVHVSSDLTMLAEKLCLQDWLDRLDDDALAAVYQGRQTEAGA